MSEFNSLNDDLENVIGGIEGSNNSLIYLRKIFELLKVDITDEKIIELVEKGGSFLRNYAKDATNNNPMCNLIPIFDNIINK